MQLNNDGDKFNKMDLSLRSVLYRVPLTQFEHLVHYGGSYSCYSLNKVLSAHVWHHANIFGKTRKGSSNADMVMGMGFRRNEKLLDFLKKGSTDVSFDALNGLMPAGAPKLASTWSTSVAQGVDILGDALGTYGQELRSGNASNIG